jgi:hypothetical protein
VLRVGGILAREEQPPLGVEPIEWRLLTPVAVTTFTEAWERIAWYPCRWTREVYHQILQSGCRTEDRQFEQAERWER